MSTSTGPAEPDYQINAQYYDLIFPAPVREQLTTALRTALPGVRRIAEIGAGTGLFTQVLADLVGEGGEVFAIEPSSVMRAALATRLAGLADFDDGWAAQRVTIVPADALTAQIPESVDAVVLLNVVMHFSPEQRIPLWRTWASALRPGGLIIVESQYPQQPVDVPETVVPGRTLGRYTYDTVIRAEALDDHRVRWVMTYRTRMGDELVRTDVACFDCHVIPDRQLHQELRANACEPMPDSPDGVLVWRCGGSAPPTSTDRLVYSNDYQFQ